MKRDSVGWFKAAVKVPRKRRKRVVMAHVERAKRRRSRMKMMVPMVVRPRNRCGLEDKRSAMLPVDMVRVNHAQVKWWRRSLRETVLGIGDFSWVRGCWCSWSIVIDGSQPMSGVCTATEWTAPLIGLRGPRGAR